MREFFTLTAAVGWDVGRDIEILLKMPPLWDRSTGNIGNLISLTIFHETVD